MRLHPDEENEKKSAIKAGMLTLIRLRKITIDQISQSNNKEIEIPKTDKLIKISEELQSKINVSLQELKN
ncbi:hypothetical protein J2746_000790 [Methanolobus bombayensis]|nr:hypothetical protein [Methanolobus bombayensis]